MLWPVSNLVFPMAPRILIVDDSALVRNFLRACFESEPGWQICGEAVNGSEGIEKAQQLQPNLIVLDLSMPVMNGLEAARVFRELMPSVPLIMFTSFHTRHLEQEAQAAGISRVILKSESLADLIACVRSLTKEVA
jgi:DNA-binding NarL/FixJ family response regulator